MMKRQIESDVDTLIELLKEKLKTDGMSMKDWLGVTDRIIKLMALRQRTGKKPKGGGYNPFATTEPPEEESNGRSHRSLI